MNTIQTRRQLLVAAGAAATGTVAGCTSPESATDTGVAEDSPDRSTVAIGSKRFTENILLAELSRALLTPSVPEDDLLTDDIGARTTVERHDDSCWWQPEPRLQARSQAVRALNQPLIRE